MSKIYVRIVLGFVFLGVGIYSLIYKNWTNVALFTGVGIIFIVRGMIDYRKS